MGITCSEESVSIEIAMAFADAIILNANKDTENLSWNNPEPFGNSSTLNDNPENVESGDAGIILYLLDVYRVTGNQNYLGRAEKALAKLVQYCLVNESDDYSFYKGRGGVCYTLCRMYDMTKERTLLVQAYELIKGCRDNYLTCSYVSDSIYDGRAGTLLALLHLYIRSDNELIYSFIKMFRAKIVTNVRVNANGIYWPRPTSLLEPCYNFGYGTAGIGFVFFQLFKVFNWKIYHDIFILSSLNKDISQSSLFYYEDQCDSEKCELNNSWLTGTSGLMAGNWSNKRNYNELISDLYGYIFSQLKKECNSLSWSLINGLPGTALCMMDVVRSHSDQYAASIPCSIMAYLKQNPLKIEIKGGLLGGSLGLSYFLIQSYGRMDSGNILLPSVPSYTSNKHQVEEYEFSLDVIFSLLNDLFPRTLEVLRHNYPLEFEALLNGCFKAIIEFKDWVSFMDNLLPNEHGISILKDVYHLELERIRVTTAEPIDVAFFKQSLLRYKLLTERYFCEDWLRKDKIGVTGRSRKLYTKWNWSGYTANTSRTMYDEFETPPLYNNYRLLYITSVGVVAEAPFIIADLVDKFAEPVVTFDVIQEMKSIFRLLDEESGRELAQLTGNETYDQFLSRIDFLIEKVVEQLIIDDVLAFCDPPISNEAVIN